MRGKEDKDPGRQTGSNWFSFFFMQGELRGSRGKAIQAFSFDCLPGSDSETTFIRFLT